MSVSELEREVAGTRCREVLERLSDYMDGDLPMAEVRRVDAHLRGCDRCERFGGAFGEAVGLLRRELAAAALLDEEVEARLRARLARAL